MRIIVQTLAAACALAAGAAEAQIDLSTYVRTGIFNLPSTTLGSNLLANEASAVTYNWDRDSLFVVGDGGTAIVEVSKTGALIGSMTLTGFTDTAVGDPEGITYVGNGQFVLSLERARQAALFTYVGGGNINIAATTRVTLGPLGAGNNGNEGIAWDGGNNFVLVKQRSPQQTFSTSISFAGGTSSNGNSTTEPTGLFNPAVFNAVDLSDVATLSQLPGSLTGTDANNLLVISASTGSIYEVTRSGAIMSSLFLGLTPTSTVPATAALMHEGVTMDFAGNLYIVNENGGGSSAAPQMWVYAPIPEPGSYALLLAGLAAVAGVTRRRVHRA